MRVRSTEIGLVLLSVVLLATTGSIVLAAPPTMKVHSSGWYYDSVTGSRNTFRMNVAKTGEPGDYVMNPHNYVVFHDRDHDLEVYTNDIHELDFHTLPDDSIQVTIRGYFKTNDSVWYEFYIIARDGGEPGKGLDYFKIEMQLYRSEGWLGGGHIKAYP